MRIRKIQIDRWRNFENVAIELREDANLVCLVGANGTGKSHLLELISACAHHFGLSAGIEIPRGNPFDDDHSFSVEIYLAENVSEALDQAFGNPENYNAWDRTLTLTSESGHAMVLEAGGILDPALRVDFARQIIEELKRSREVHHLSLDADRAYPKTEIRIHEFAQAYEMDWDTTELTRGRSYMPTRMLYDEWIKYMLAKENQAGTKLIQRIRMSRETDQSEPLFEDHFDFYKRSLQIIFPHLAFTGVDLKKKTLLFDTTGIELSFGQLSGGEREIAFLIGQIDRFRLRNGLFLLDEPELHLNTDLIRAWVAYLSGTVTTGQVWLATHSLEAVEAAGQNSTFLLERNEATKKVDSVTSLSDRRVHSTLSRAVGTPAFSLSQLRFIYVEGEEGIGERDRFRRICGDMTNSRFIECGSCNEVARRISAIRSLQEETDQDIRVGGIVDRDWRSRRDAEEFATGRRVFVLPVHEVENLFLHPRTLERILQQNGLEPNQGAELVRGECDPRAGRWIYQQTWATQRFRDFGEPHINAKRRAFELRWDDIAPDIQAAMMSVTNQETNLEAEQRVRLSRSLEACARIYRRIRSTDELWKRCEGKEVFHAIAQQLGFASAPAAERAILAAWESDDTLLPNEVGQIREYVNGI